MSAPGSVVRVTVELPAGVVMSEGIHDAMRGLLVDSDGVIRRPLERRFYEQPHPVVGTWALVDGPLIP